MIFNKHLDVEGMHAFLSPSKHHWINYDEDKLEEVYYKALAKQRGTELHDFANRCINLGVKLPKTKKTLNMYVNDAIGFGMTPEQVLYFSSNCYGTADAISFKKNLLRIHDLKTGMVPGSMSQLFIYASIFCLEYDVHPNEIDFELRIYQFNDIDVCIPKKEDLLYIMDKIILFDRRIEMIKLEEGGVL